MLTILLLLSTIYEPFDTGLINDWYGNQNLEINGYLYQQFPLSPTRIVLKESQQLFVSFDGKFSGFAGGVFAVMTNLDGDFSDYESSHLTISFDINKTLTISLQDSKNIDVKRVGSELSSLTESRAVAGCNGDSDGYGNGRCYKKDGNWRNRKGWSLGNSSDGWSRYVIFFKLNTVSNGEGVENGEILAWIDGQLAINASEIIYKTGENPTMAFRQFLLLSGNGEMYLDNLTISTTKLPDNCIHEADKKPCDNRVSDEELIAYIEGWRSKEKDVIDLVKAIFFWRKA